MRFAPSRRNKSAFGRRNAARPRLLRPIILRNANNTIDERENHKFRRHPLKAALFGDSTLSGARSAFSPASFYIFALRRGIYVVRRVGVRGFSRCAHSGHFDLWPFDITILITTRKINHPTTRNVCRDAQTRHHRRNVCCEAGMLGNHFIGMARHRRF